MPAPMGLKSTGEGPKLSYKYANKHQQLRVFRKTAQEGDGGSAQEGGGLLGWGVRDPSLRRWPSSQDLKDEESWGKNTPG